MMHKSKLKISEQARKVFPERLSSLVIGEVNVMGSDKEVESGEELQRFEPHGFALKRMIIDQIDSFGISQKTSRDDVDEKRSDLEHELSRKEINLDKLQRVASSGIPDGGSLRATIWKLLLGYLPASRDLWEKELTESRLKYAKLKEELLLEPSELSRRRDENLKRLEHANDSEIGGGLERYNIAIEDHPLSLGKTSVWHQYFEFTEISDQIDRDLYRTHPDVEFFSGDSPLCRKNKESMRHILLLFAKLNPAITYVQGMNEVLAPLFYVFRTDNDEHNAANAEADSFSCFVRLMSGSVDHFCQELDSSSVGIHSTLSNLSQLLKTNDEELWHHLEYKTKVNPQFYAFRWITLLLTQEFSIHDILRIWDTLLSNAFGVQEMLLSICCAMLICVRSKLLRGDFADNLKLLQHFPEVDVEHLLHVARDITADTSFHPPV